MPKHKLNLFLNNMKIYFSIFFACLFVLYACKKESALINDDGVVYNLAIVKVDSGIDIGDIYKTKNFSAFTDIAYFNGLWYVVFRIGTSHSGGEDGQIKILTSADGEAWKVMDNIAVNSFDLRDPKLTIDSLNNNLYLSFFGRNVLKHGRVDAENYFTELDKSANNWQPLKQIQYNKINNDQFIFWRYTYHKGKMYCIAYSKSVADSAKSLALFVSDNNFFSYTFLGNLKLYGSPSETTLRFAENDSMYFIPRTETINSPIGVSLPDYKNVNWINNPLYSVLASPDFLLYKNKLLITARDSKTQTFKFFCYNPTRKTVEKVYTFPSGYETGYGGMSFNPHNPDELWVTYYSATNDSTSIKLAKISLPKFL
jgi:hypothetical protein